MKTEKRLYSYFIIKPDGIRFVEEINKELNDNFNCVKYFKIDDFSTIIKKLYFRHYQKKGLAFASSFNQYLQASNDLYGNKAILAIVTDVNNENGEEFRQKVYDIKMKLRAELGMHNIRILSNNPEVKPNNYVRILDEDGNELKQRSFKEKGNYRINDLNVIHSPDSDTQSTVEELKILLDSNIMKEENIISEKSLQELLRFKTIQGFQVDKNEIKPNISGFINADIKNTIEDR